MVWLLRIEWDGIVVRRSTRPGEWGGEPWDGGLDGADVTSALSRAGAGASAAVSLSIRWPEVAGLVAGGRNLSTATAELSVIPAGGTYASRSIVAAGPLTQPTFGSVVEPVAFTIRPDNDDTGALVPEPEHRVTEDSWPAAPKVGAVYPTVFGSPGFMGAASIIPATPALYVGGNVAVVAGHHCGGTGRVTVFGENTSGEETSGEEDLVETEDALGRKVTTVDTTGFATDKPLFVGWGTASGPAYGIHSDGEPVRTAGDAVSWMMARAGATTAFELLRAQLAAVRVSAFIDEPVSPRRWVEDQVLPLLPVSLTWTATGTRPVLRPTIPAPGPHLRVEPGRMVRKGVVTYDAAESAVVNDHRFTWGWDARENGMTRSTRTGGELAPAWVRNSVLLHGERSGATSSAVVYDAASAAYVGAWRCREGAYARRVVRYTCSVTEQTLALVPGQTVTLTDPELFLDAAPGWVSETSWSAGGLIVVTLTLFDPGEV